MKSPSFGGLKSARTLRKQHIFLQITSYNPLQCIFLIFSGGFELQAPAEGCRFGSGVFDQLIWLEEASEILSSGGLDVLTQQF